MSARGPSCSPHALPGTEPAPAPGAAATRRPARSALLIQVAATAAAALAAFLSYALAGWAAPLWAALLLQSACATILTWHGRLPRWWLPLQAAFLPAAAALRTLDLPATWFGAGFAALFAIYGTPWRTRVPLYLSGPGVREAVEHALPDRPGLRLLDAGCGLGDVLLHLDRVRPDLLLHGIEIAFLPWLVARCRALGRRAVTIQRGDYRHADFAAYDVVFAYLSPAVMTELWGKARSEMGPGSILLSCEFPIPGAQPDFAVDLPGRTRQLYGWRF